MIDKVVRRSMNQFIHSIHKNTVVIYKRYHTYYSIDEDIYVYKGLFGFKYVSRNNRMVIVLDKNYLAYILKKFKEQKVAYVIIQVNYGYDKLSCYYDNGVNAYRHFYKKGKRMIRNEKRIEVLINYLREKRNMGTLKKVDDYLNDYS